jgi:membrane-associated phospholipid phosphatase
MAVDVAQAYSDAFAPEVFVLFCTLLVLGYERRARRTRDRSPPPSRIGSPSRRGLIARVGVVAVAWGIAFAIYQSAPLLFERHPSWADDLFGGLGLAVGFAVIGLVWTRRRWGRLVPGFAALLIAVTVVHSLITPLWNVSSHVVYAGAPAGYLWVLDRRFVPLLVIPLGMVVSRPLVGAHTWLQSVAGLAVAGLVVAAFVRRRSPAD